LDEVLDQETVHPALAYPRRRLVLAASLMATFMAAVESTIVATAMPTIVADLGGFSLFSWVFAAYLLAMAVTIPLYGRLADIYGRKRVFAFGTSLFLIGTSLCGFASTMGMLVLFRAVQGFGAGAIQPIASTVVGDIYTPAERARVQGLISSVFGVSAIAGPALGAFIVEHLHWSLVFWVNLPIGVASIVMYRLFLQERLEPKSHRVDYLGSALLAVGVGTAMLALVQAGRLGAATTIGLAAIGILALGALVVQERRAAEPIVPFRLWRRRVIALANLGTFGTGAAMMGVSAFLPAYVQGVMGRSPGVAGLVLGCQSVSWTFATFLAARVMIRSSYRASAAIGGLSLLLGGVMLAFLQPSSGVAWAAAGSLVTGVGMGFCNPSFLVSIQASVGWNERGVATGGIMFMRMLGQSLGAAVFGAVVNFGIASRIPHAGDAVNRLMEPSLRHGLGAAEIARLSAAVGAAVHEVYLMVIVLAVATLAVAVAFPKGLSPIRARRG
jgi:EmrB/QacA subfamily drug resistance transporter